MAIYQYLKCFANLQHNLIIILSSHNISRQVFHLHTQFYCENGGDVYGRISIISNNLSIILRINRYNYHKYCLNYNVSYLFEQIKKRHICLAERCVVYPYIYYT